MNGSCPRPAFGRDIARTVALALLVACGGGGNNNGDGGPGDGDVAPDAEQVFTGDPLIGVGDVERIANGFLFVEGPQWRGTDLVFSDVEGDTIYRYTPGGAPPVPERSPSNNSNGLALDAQGRLYAAEHGSRSLRRDATVIAAMFEGERLSSPNDVIVRSDGTVYFTDPPFGGSRDLPFIGVFRISGGTLIAERRGALAERPNGIGLAPDEQRLYVADSADGVLYRYGVAAGGELGAREVHAQTSGTADGLAIDRAGNIFVATRTGVEVFAPDGSRWGVISVPEQPANCAFGGAALRTLFITAQTGLYSVELAHPGLPNN
jgi:gluconolactonase